MQNKFQNYSHASKLRQSKIPPHIRKENMRALALKKWASKTPEEKRAHAMKMVAARSVNKPIKL